MPSSTSKIPLPLGVTSPSRVVGGSQEIQSRCSSSSYTSSTSISSSSPSSHTSSSTNFSSTSSTSTSSHWWILGKKWTQPEGYILASRTGEVVTL